MLNKRDMFAIPESTLQLALHDGHQYMYSAQEMDKSTVTIISSKVDQASPRYDHY